MKVRTAAFTGVSDSTRQVVDQGFSIVDGLLSENEISESIEMLDRLIGVDQVEWGPNPHYRDHWMVMNLMFRAEIFQRVLDSHFIPILIDPLLGESSILYSFTSSSMPPSASNFSRRVHTDSPRVIPGYSTNVGLLIALNEFTPENGATELLPNSHVLFEAPSEEVFETGMIQALLKPGQGLLFNARLWHRGGFNSSSRPRHALTLNFCRSYMRSHFDFSAMASDDYVQSVSPQIKRFLGWNVRMPKSLEEYYVPDTQRRYRANQG